MSESDGFELHVIDFSGDPGAADRRAEQDRQRDESRRRYIDYLTAELLGIDTTDTAALAQHAIDALTSWRRDGAAKLCGCSCHPRLPESDFHDYGFGCVCTQSGEDTDRGWAEWAAERDAFWASPEGLAVEAERAAQEAALDEWLTSNSDVTVTRHGGVVPEQWMGSIDGHTFYFRERHEQWTIELDLRPTGRVSKVWVGGDFDDETSFEFRKIEDGDVIAEGTTRAAGYGETPLDRIRFITRTVRTHLGREGCPTHAGAVIDNLQLLLGNLLRWCPTCGSRLDDR